MTTETCDSAASTDVEQAFRSIVGTHHVSSSKSSLSRHSEATYATNNSACLVVRPGSEAQVVACVQLANKKKLTLYPISTGLNTGYGSAVPSSKCAIILDLGRLDTISRYSEELGCVTVGPGVTQEQLYRFLDEKTAPFWFDVTGSYPQHSLIGNIVERGFGHTMQADHFAHIAGFRVVLPTGEVFETGFGQFDNAVAKDVYRWGVGPQVDGLFTQSNLGIVLSSTIWLIPKPDYCQNFAFSVEGEDQLADLVNRLRPLRLDGTIRCAMHIGNDYKVLSSTRQYPWEDVGSVTPLHHRYLAQRSANWDFGAWNVSGALYGSRAEVRAARRKIKKQLGNSVKRMRFIDDRLLGIARRLSGPLQRCGLGDLDDALRLVAPIFGMTRGVPSAEAIKSIYWRKKIKPDTTPLAAEKDRCGLIWLAPVLPALGEHAAKVWEITRDIMLSRDFEPSVSMTTVNERSLDCVIALSYDRDIPGEDERAMACYHALSDALADEGYYSYRLPNELMGVLQRRSPAAKQFYERLKHAIDPLGTLAPGRYEEGAL